MLLFALVCLAGGLSASLMFVNLEEARGRAEYELMKFSIATRGVCMIAVIVAAVALQVYGWWFGASE